MTQPSDTPAREHGSQEHGAQEHGTEDAPARDAGRVADALARLDAALARLEAGVVRRLEKEAEPDDRDAELALMDEDRARLAAALDAASARLAAVEATTGAVGHRLDRAIETVQGVLARP